MNKILKRQKYFLFIALVAIFFIAGAVFVVNAGTGHNVRGWLWGGTNDGSDNRIGLGWISTNNLNVNGAIDYGIFIPENDGSVTGYAWSENIGWIYFQPSGPYPAGPNSGVRREGDKLIGWARILSIKDAGEGSGGWQGWIKLSGLTQNNFSYGVKIDPTTQKLSGYAWSDELGWINFNLSNIMFPPSCTFSANPTQIFPSAKSTLIWQCQYANSCEIAPGIGPVRHDNGVKYLKEVTPALTTEYILTCSNDIGSRSWTTTVMVRVSGVIHE